MIILGLDTALGACSVALLADGRTLAHDHRDKLRGHAEALAPMVETLMREAGLGFSQLDRIAVTTGPGTFTGQRVGLAFARALRLALNKPAIGVTTLDAMAAEALTKQRVPWALAAADAKRGEIYLGARSAQGETLLAPELIAAETVPARVVALAKVHGQRFALAGTASETIAHRCSPSRLDCCPSTVWCASPMRSSSPGSAPTRRPGRHPNRCICVRPTRSCRAAA